MKLFEFERRYSSLNLHVVNHIFDAKTVSDWHEAIRIVNSKSYTRDKHFYTMGFVQVMVGHIIEHHNLNDDDRISFDFINYIMRDHQEEFLNTTDNCKAVITVVRQYLPNAYRVMKPIETCTFDPNPLRRSARIICDSDED